MENSQNKQYICPVKCEGIKVYDQPGKCPACKMPLVTVVETNSHGGHGKCC